MAPSGVEDEIEAAAVAEEWDDAERRMPSAKALPLRGRAVDVGAGAGAAALGRGSCPPNCDFLKFSIALVDNIFPKLENNLYYLYGIEFLKNFSKQKITFHVF
tara:strand:+ start:270 stop:578 length:309 start_codon:yes stop_codon:yes gene_type:complete